MPIFTQTLQRINEQNPQEAIKKMASHIKYLQEQLEYTLHNLDSQHITEINTDSTTITNGAGTSTIGSYTHLTGANGESFRVGKNAQGQFEFAVCAKGDAKTMYLNSSGELVITDKTNLTINGGKW